MKQIIVASIMFFVVSTTFAQNTSRWTFASAKITETNRKNGALLSQQSINSPEEIPDKVHFFRMPREITFFGENDSLVNLTFRNDYIENATARRDDKTLTVYTHTAEDSLAAYITAEYKNFVKTDKILSLQYNYIYTIGNNDIIDGVMKITFKAYEEPKNVYVSNSNNSNVKKEQNNSTATSQPLPQKQENVQVETPRNEQQRGVEQRGNKPNPFGSNPKLPPAFQRNRGFQQEKK